MRRTTLAIALLVVAAGCSRAPQVPRDRPLWRIDSPWVSPPEGGGTVRTAPGTILSFRGSGEFVEQHCQLIERDDQSVYIASRAPRVVVVGTWKQDGREVTAVRQSIARTPSSAAAAVAGRDPLCAQTELVFRVERDAVVALTGDMRGTYTPLDRLIAPDYESYVTRARQSPVRCAEATPD